MSRKNPILIVFAGLTGTGKSTLTEVLAKKLNIPVISSDIVRKKLADISPEVRRYNGFEEGIYSREFTDRTYYEMLKRGMENLKKGSSVILDASFRKRYHRKLVLDMASKLGIKLFIIEIFCNVKDIKKRLYDRMEDKKSISDGRWEIYTRQKDDFEPINEIKEDSHIILDTTESIGVCIEKILEKIG
ncbi:MAG: AAA family ATPase [Nitrospinota bacterium]